MYMYTLAAGYERTRNGLKLEEQATRTGTTDERDKTIYDRRVMTLAMYMILK